MSSLANWSYTNIATIWPKTLDQFSQPTYGTPYTIACTWEDTGQTQTDEDGREFVPSATYWFEAEYGSSPIPGRGDYIAKFDRTGIANPLDAGGQMIRQVTSWDMSPFGNETPDWAVYTSRGAR